MKVPMPTISNPGSFVYDSENPTKYTEACSHAIHRVLYALSEAGFEISDGEGSQVMVRLARDRDFDELTIAPLDGILDEE
jgi:hypothetical protein